MAISFKLYRQNVPIVMNPNSLPHRVTDNYYIFDDDAFSFLKEENDDDDDDLDVNIIDRSTSPSSLPPFVPSYLLVFLPTPCPIDI